MIYLLFSQINIISEMYINSIKFLWNYFHEILISFILFHVILHDFSIGDNYNRENFKDNKIQTSTAINNFSS